jgi:hypothetical protein
VKTTKTLTILVLAFGLIVCLPKVGQAAPMGTAWTYQGRLIDANNPADGLYDFEFKVYDANVAGTQKDSTIDVNEMDVIDGYFAVLLDFGSDVFNGDARWLQIGVRPGEMNDPNEYTILEPRCEVTPVPYALQTRGLFVDNARNLRVANSISLANAGDISNIWADGLVIGSNGGIYGILGTQGSNRLGLSYNGYRQLGTFPPEWEVIGIVGSDTTAQIEMGDDGIALCVQDGRVDGDPAPEARMKILPDGRVGIGTASPTAKLDINGQTKIRGGLEVGAVRPWILTDWGAGSDIDALLPGSVQGGLIQAPAAHHLTVGIYGNEIWDSFSVLTDSNFDGSLDTVGLYVKSDGKVGIGTTTPGANLEVNGQVKITGGSPAAGRVLTSDAGGLATWQTPFTGDSNWIISGTNMYSGVSGNVGIGTSSPSAKLAVQGDISVASAYKIAGNTVLSIPSAGNTLVGVGAGANNTGNYNTFSGDMAGYNNETGHANTFSGYQAGWHNTTGYDNTFGGYEAGYSNTTGWGNTFSGNYAGYSNNRGYYNTFSGHYAGYSNNTGYYNTFSGYCAGSSNTTGNYNTFSGAAAGYNNTEGYANTFSGYCAGLYNTTGLGNTFVGVGAGNENQTGNFNVFIGYKAGCFETGSNNLYIANGSSDPNVLIYGDFTTGGVGLGTTSPSEKLDVDGTARLRGISASAGATYVHVDGNGKLWKIGSSKRYKTNIRDLEDNSDAVLRLRPVRFEWKTTGQEDIGLVAEDVQEALTDLVIYDEEGRPEAVKYDRVSLYLLPIVKDLKAENESLKQENEQIKDRLAAIEAVVAKFGPGSKMAHFG